MDEAPAVEEIKDETGATEEEPGNMGAPEAAVEEKATAPVPKEDGRTVDALFRFSDFIHVGPGAAECEDGEDGSCGNPLHFHAWCRLPNKFQIASIRTKAQAAKARAIRRLKDPECDDHAILEGDLEVIREGGKDAMVEEILSRSYWKDHLAAMKELAEAEDSEFATITEDQERYKVLSVMSDDERPQDEWDELVRHLDKWNSEVDRVREENQRPQRESLDARSDDDLLKVIRDERIAQEGDQQYMVVYSKHEWLCCTLKPRPAEKGRPVDKVFGSVEHMEEAAPEVIEAIEAVFNDLEGEFANRAAVRAEGN